jgi:hypothetical protein
VSLTWARIERLPFAHFIAAMNFVFTEDAATNHLASAA